MIHIPLDLAQGAYRMAYMVEDIGIVLESEDVVIDAASIASDLLDAISVQAGPLAAEEARPVYRRGIKPEVNT